MSDRITNAAFTLSILRDLLHLIENTFDRKRIFANPSAYLNPNSNPNTNTNPNLNSKAQLCFRTNEMTLFFDQVHRYHFDDQERKLMFVNTAFQVLKLKFLACSMKQAFLSSSQTKLCSSFARRKYFFTRFPFGNWLSNLHV